MIIFLVAIAGRDYSTENGVTPMSANSREDGVYWSQFYASCFINWFAGHVLSWK